MRIGQKVANSGSGSATPRWRHRQFGFCCFILVFMLGAPSVSQDNAFDAAKAAELLAKLKNAATFSASIPTQRELAALGNGVIPLVLEELSEANSASGAYPFFLLNTLTWMESDEATCALLSVALHGQKGDAMFDFSARRSLAKRSIPCEISEADYANISAAVVDWGRPFGFPFSYGCDMSLLLSQCQALSPEARLRPLFQRLLFTLAPCGEQREVIDRLQPDQREIIAVTCLLAIGNVGAAGIPYLKNVLEEMQTLEERMVAEMALGRAGDRGMADVLKERIKTEQDVRLRGMLVRAYARAAEKDAIPFLEELQKDATTTGYHHMVPKQPVADAAREELLRHGVEVIYPTPVGQGRSNSNGSRDDPQ